MARGGRAGGRSGGGFRGGSFRGSSFHGTRHGAGSDEGCGIRILFVALYLVVMLIAAISNRTYEPSIDYSDAALERFASGRYEALFSESSTCEDHLLLTLAVWPDRCDYAYITWAGDHICDGTFALLGGNDTLLGMTLEQEVAYRYGTSLSYDLERVLDQLAQGITAASPEGSYTCSEDHAAAPSSLINESSLTLHDSRLNNALAAFTERTGIPIVLLIAEAEDIFR